jgi:hypothetical protein
MRIEAVCCSRQANRHAVSCVRGLCVAAIAPQPRPSGARVADARIAVRTDFTA